MQFYTRYLERYLSILILAQGVDRINLYDLFCGEGRYSDGNTGSAIRAVEAVWKALDSNSLNKPIKLHLNDLDANKIDKLKTLLADKESIDKKFSISFSCREAVDFLDRLIEGIPGQRDKVRSLIFIDPYGYKAIQKDQIESLMLLGKTEIVLFLPIEQMYRFQSKATDEVVENQYKPLKYFIDQFQLNIDTIGSEKEFIGAIERALSFNDKYYATSFSIKNHTGHYYGMFFITSNLKGLENIVDVKWELDAQQGKGFTGNSQLDFILELESKAGLYDDLIRFLNIGQRNNIELYEYVLKCGFRTKQANEILRQLCKDGMLHTLDALTGKPARKNSFKLSYSEYKRNVPSIIYNLVEGGYGE